MSSSDAEPPTKSDGAQVFDQRRLLTLPIGVTDGWPLQGPRRMHRHAHAVLMALRRTQDSRACR